MTSPNQTLPRLWAGVINHVMRTKIEPSEKTGLEKCDNILEGVQNELRGNCRVAPIRRIIRERLERKLTICPQCGKEMRINFAYKPFRPIVSCISCKTFVADNGQIKTAVG